MESLAGGAFSIEFVNSRRADRRFADGMRVLIGSQLMAHRVTSIQTIHVSVF
jgi:hypothetical protein